MLTACSQEFVVEMIRTELSVDYLIDRFHRFCTTTNLECCWQKYIPYTTNLSSSYMVVCPFFAGVASQLMMFEELLEFWYRSMCWEWRKIYRPFIERACFEKVV